MIDYKMGYKFTDDIETIQKKLDKSYKDHCKSQMADLLTHTREIETARMLDPSLRPETDYFIWHDPWELLDQI